MLETDDGYRAVFETCPLPMWVFDRRTLEFLAVNEAAVRQYGYSREEFLSMTILDMRPEEDAAAVRGLARGWDDPSGAGAPPIRLNHRRRDGRLVEAEVSWSPVVFQGREALQTVVHEIDETRESDRRFQGLLESAPDAMVLVDRSGKILLVNSQTEKLFGWERRDLLGQPVEVLIPPSYRATHPGHRAAYGEDPHIRPMGAGLELYGQRRDGSTFPVEISLSPLQTEGEVLVMSAIRDISDRKRASEKLSQLAAIVEYADDAIIGNTLDGTVVTWNPGAERMFGYRAAEMVGRPLSVLVPPGSGNDLVRNTEKIRRGTPVVRFESLGARKDGQLIETSVTISAIRDSQGAISGASVLARDITDRRRSEQAIRELNADLERRVADRTAELERSNAELQQFAYVVSHDLQEPLRMVSSYTQLIAKRYQGKLDTDADEFIAYAVDGAARMHDLIDDLLRYSRLGTAGGEFTIVDCEELVEKALVNLRLAIEESGGSVTRGPLPRVAGDTTQLVQLFQNLIGNALKFRRSAVAPAVRIDAEVRGGEWLFAISDNGIGIDPRFSERIFGMFQRLHGRGEYPGTGVGLTICRRIVQRHGGRIWVEATPGGGSVFRFTLSR